MSNTASNGTKWVLVVDDNAINRRLAAAFVTRFGMNVAEAQGGAEALEMLGARPYDLVLLDISMPGMCGNEVLRRLRADPRFAALPVIAYTAHALPEEKQGLVAAGFDDLLIKPITLKAVESVLANFLAS